jgi:NitT/TauT family transport system permease protein
MLNANAGLRQGPVTLRQYPGPNLIRRTALGLPDIAVILGALVLLALIARVGAGAFASFIPSNTLPAIDLDPRNLPYYAARSTLRMFVALSWSLVFTLVYGYAAAKSRKASRALVPLLDILQSVPVLGFLSITVTGFIALFHGSLLGLEFASIFAVFTSQAWNMTFAFYQSLHAIPHELDEAARLYRLSGWQRFVKLELPNGTIGLVWNSMMSFGGGWFFVAASEAISVLNHTYTLPGLGSYLQAAINAKDLHALGFALLTMAIVIVLVDQLFWRPIVAWSGRFRFEQNAAARRPSSWLYELIRRASLPRLIAVALRPAGDAAGRVLSMLTRARPPRAAGGSTRGVLVETIYNVALVLVVVALAFTALRFILMTVGVGEIFKASALGLATFGRVLVLIIIATLVWTPLGVAIGFTPRLAQFLQPVVLLLASFPANFIFPFAALLFLRYHVDINYGCIILMALGAQWYILFNTIAGAQGIATELREMSSTFRLRSWTLWRRLIIPGIFASWVTGAITAGGGAWNASIVAEVVSWGSTSLTATGLGSYIASATMKGDWPRITLGVSVMSLFVVGLNRTLWRSLYKIAETRYQQ